MSHTFVIVNVLSSLSPTLIKPKSILASLSFSCGPETSAKRANPSPAPF